MNWFNRLKIGGRLNSGFSLMTVIVLAIGLTSMFSSRTLNGSLRSITERRMPALESLLQADRDLHGALAAERSMIFANAGSDQFQALVRDYDEHVAQAEANWKIYTSFADSDKEREIVPRFDSAHREWAALSRRIVDARVADTREGRREALDLSLGQAAEAFLAMESMVAELTDLTLAQADAAREHAGAVYTFTRFLQLGMIIMGLLAGLLLAWAIRRSIAGPLSRLIDGLTTTASQLTAASSQVAAASQQLATGASSQAAAIEETSASLEHMSSMTGLNASSANDADSLMQSTNAVVRSANEEMQRLEASMREISEASLETQKIVRTIDEIAFQTNLLALNAAVEAARAGAAGAGFAVVAEEVRGLAQRAAGASRNTAGMIEGTVARVNEGSALVGRACQAFAGVSSNAEKVGTLVSGIASASREQSQGIGQVTQAVAGMDRTTQANAASAEQSASAAQQLSAQAHQMMTYVADLEALVGSGVPQAAPAARQRAARPAAVGTSRKSTKASPAGAIAHAGRAGQVRVAAPAAAGSSRRQAAAHGPETTVSTPQVVMSLEDDDFFDDIMPAPAGRRSEGR